VSVAVRGKVEWFGIGWFCGVAVVCSGREGDEGGDAGIGRILICRMCRLWQFLYMSGVFVYVEEKMVYGERQWVVGENKAMCMCCVSMNVMKENVMKCKND